MVLKMVNPGINCHFYIDPINERDCRDWPCKSTQEPCKNILRVPCAYFRVTLRDCAIHTSRWVDFADFGLVGFRFFYSIGKDYASFCQWDYRSFTVCSGVCKAILRDGHTDMLFAPYGHYVPLWERIQGYFSPTLRHLHVEDVHFLFPWIAGVNIFSRIRESGLRDEYTDMRVAHGDAMVARNRRSECVWVWKKKCC